MTPEEILQTVCGDLGVDILEKQEVSYKCYCSRERVSAALLSLGRGELEEIIAGGQGIPGGVPVLRHGVHLHPGGHPGNAGKA